MVQYEICAGVTFGAADKPVEVLNEHMFRWLDIMYQPRSSVCVARICLILMMKACFWSQAGGSSSVDP